MRTLQIRYITLQTTDQTWSHCSISIDKWKGVSGVLMGMFWWNKLAKLGYINLSNRRPKTVTYGRNKSADLDSDSDGLGKICGFRIHSESITTLIICLWVFSSLALLAASVLIKFVSWWVQAFVTVHGKLFVISHSRPHLTSVHSFFFQLLYLCCLFNAYRIRERTIRLAADTIRFNSMQKNIGRYYTDTIPIRFAYLIAYCVRRNDDDGGHCWTEYWRRDTASTGATRERRESVQKGGLRGGTEKDRGGRPRRALLCSWCTAAAPTVALS